MKRPVLTQDEWNYLAHHINNPLTIALLNLQLLEMEVDNKKIQQVVRALQRIKDVIKEVKNEE